MASNNRSKAAKAVIAGDVQTLTAALVANTAKAGRAAYRDAIGDAVTSVHIAADDALRLKAFKAAILPLINAFHKDADKRARVLSLILSDCKLDGDGRSAAIIAGHLSVFCDNLMPVVRGIGTVSDTGKVREVKGKLKAHILKTDVLDLLRAWGKLDKALFHGTSMTARFLTAMVAVTGADAASVQDAAVAVAA